MKIITIVSYSTILTLSVASSVLAEELIPTEQLGKSIFFDKNLSINQNQACAACHGPEAGWTGPSEVFNGCSPPQFHIF